MRATRLQLPIVLAAAALAGGCGGDDDGTASGCPPAGATTELQQSSAEGSDITYLTDVTVEPARCGDRVEFAFRDMVPAARVEYQPEDTALTEDGSGNRLQADGDAFLVVRLEPAATAEAHGDQLEMTYEGPRRLKPENTTSVEEIVKTGDFEAVVTWAIGLSEERPFQVTSSEHEITVEID
jgi:hypothetical protein